MASNENVTIQDQISGYRVLTQILERGMAGGLTPMIWTLSSQHGQCQLNGTLSEEQTPVPEWDFETWADLLTRLAGRKPAFEFGPLWMSADDDPENGIFATGATWEDYRGIRLHIFASWPDAGAADDSD